MLAALTAGWRQVCLSTSSATTVGTWHGVCCRIAASGLEECLRTLFRDRVLPCDVCVHTHMCCIAIASSRVVVAVGTLI
jgi:hypothetical protein